MVLFGPPGTGKTTLARMTAEHADAAFEELSAVNAGRPEVREVIARARERRRAGRSTIFFLDEIHRFNKAQQDALLPAVEEGTITLVGATTENPYFEVNSALLSRAQVYELHALERRRRRGPPAARARPRRVRRDRGRRRRHRLPRGPLGRRRARRAERARARLRDRRARRRRVGRVTVQDAEDAMQRKAVLYDKGGDQHYDYISAWIKSTRGSDPDASLYYLAAMLEGGEDPRYIARRMIILASEDIGNADPQALVVAVAAAQAVEHVGLPEGQYALSQAAIYLSLAPKSNAATRAIGAARAHIAEAAPRRRPARCAPPPTPPRASSAAGRATSTRTARRATSTTRSTSPRAWSTCASTSPTTPRRRSASGWRSCGGRAAVTREARYDAIGGSYTGTRAEDPRIAAAIHAALGDARTVLNVGAGAGAYEPRDREVTAVEPSAVMRAQRPPGAAPCVDARAEALPFPDGAFDAAMAVLSDHHWTDRAAGLRELRRVARRAVVFQWDPAYRDAFWLVRDHLPDFAAGMRGTFDVLRDGARRAARDPGADPARLPRRVPDGLLAPAGGVPRPGGPGEHLRLRAAAAGAGRRHGRVAPRRPGERRLGGAPRRPPRPRGARPRLPRRGRRSERGRRRRGRGRVRARSCSTAGRASRTTRSRTCSRVQAQDLRSARLALRARGAAARAADVDAALATARSWSPG